MTKQYVVVSDVTPNRATVESVHSSRSAAEMACERDQDEIMAVDGDASEGDRVVHWDVDGASIRSCATVTQ